MEFLQIFSGVALSMPNTCSMIFKCLKKRKKEKPFESVSIRDDLDHINKQVFGTFNPNSLTLKEDEAAVLGEGQEQGKRTRKQSEDFHNARIKRRLESIDEKANDGWIPSFFNFLVSSNNNNADNDEDSVGGQKSSSSPRRSTRSASRRSSVRASMSRMMGYKEDNHDLITASELHEVLRKRFPDDEFGRESDFPRFFPNNEGSKKTKKISISKSVAIIEKHRDWMQNDCSKENADLAMELIPKNWIRKGGVDNDGAPCVYIQGARFDNKIDPTLYAIAVGALVRNMFDPAFGGEDHDSDDARGKVTVMIDVRAGNLKEPGTNYTNPVSERCERAL